MSLRDGEILAIGTISNYYDGLYVKFENSFHYWGIGDYDGTRWEAIPEPLFNELVTYERNRRKNE